MRKAALLTGLGALLASCGGAPDLGDMTAVEAKQTCLQHARGLVSPDDVRETVTHKLDRYWDVLLAVDPPRNLVLCTVNAVDGRVLSFHHGFQRRAAEKALRGGLWDDTE